MLLLEEYKVTKLGQKNYEFRLLFKDDSNNIQIRRHIPNIRFEQSGIYYLYYNQYLNKYELKTELNPNVYHFISILEITVDLDTGNVIVKDYRKSQNSRENKVTDTNINEANNSSDADENTVNIEFEQNIDSETKSNRGRRKRFEQ